MPLDRLTRHPERGSTDRARLDALLDDQLWGTLDPNTITCPTSYGSGVTCDPNPPRKP